MHKTLELPHTERELAELVAEVRRTGDRMVICEEGRPIAALVGLADLHRLGEPVEPDDHREGLAAIVGKWPGFEEIDPYIDEAIANRGSDFGRPVELD